MSRIPLPYSVEDVSALAKSLRRQLDGIEGIPSHVEMLNLLAKAGGYRNFQHLRAQEEARVDLAQPRPEPAPEPDYKLVKRVVRVFDDKGRLVRWPKKFTQRMLCLWVMWSRITPRTSMSEAEINDLLESLHLFGDHALLRRELCDRGMVSRTADGSRYMRIERRPPVEAVEVLKHMRG